MTTDLWNCLCTECDRPAYQLGTFRAVSPIRTLRRLKPLLPLAGITRLVRVTDLDTVGIPVYQAVRPNSRNMSVSQGKGLTRPQAKVSALMESLESFHAEKIPATSVNESIGEMRRRLHYDPFTLSITANDRATRFGDTAFDAVTPPIGRSEYLSDHTRCDWVPATNLTDGSETWCPRQLCELDYTMRDHFELFPFRATSNGLASGNSLLEAAIHGLCELIERDSFLSQRSRTASPEWAVDLSTIDDPVACSVLRRIIRSGLELHLWEMTGPLGVPCFEASVAQPDQPIFKGYGCHPSRVTALIRALTEAVQSRLTHISGTRDDLYRSTYRHRPTLDSLGLGSLTSEEAGRGGTVSGKPRRSYQDCPDPGLSTWRGTLDDLVNRIQRHTGTAPIAINLTRDDFQIPVIFVVAPGLKGPASRR